MGRRPEDAFTDLELFDGEDDHVCAGAEAHFVLVVVRRVDRSIHAKARDRAICYSAYEILHTYYEENRLQILVLLVGKEGVRERELARMVRVEVCLQEYAQRLSRDRVSWTLQFSDKIRPLIYPLRLHLCARKE